MLLVVRPCATSSVYAPCSFWLAKRILNVSQTYDGCGCTTRDGKQQKVAHQKCVWSRASGDLGYFSTASNTESKAGKQPEETHCFIELCIGCPLLVVWRPTIPCKSTHGCSHAKDLLPRSARVFSVRCPACRLMSPPQKPSHTTFTALKSTSPINPSMKLCN